MAGIIALRFEMQRPERGRYFFAVKALLQDVQVVQENCWWLRFDGKPLSPDSHCLAHAHVHTLAAWR